MPLMTLRRLVDLAERGGYAVGAFNVSNLEQIQAVLAAARDTGSPVILQVTMKGRVHAGEAFLRHLIPAAAEAYPEIPLAFHRDHGTSPDVCRTAVDLGFTSVMMDGSLREDGYTPSDFEYNVRVTREVVEFAHARGASVEGELGVLGGTEDGHGNGGDPRAHLTDPEQAAEFVARTGVDALAVAVGTSHGAVKFDREPDGDLLDIDRIAEIRRAVPDTPLVLHGASCVTPGQVELVARYGGRVRAGWGVPFERIRRAIAVGVRKVNVDTDLRLAFTGAVRRTLSQHPETFDPRSYLAAAREAVREEAAAHMRVFSQVRGPAARTRTAR